MKVNIGPFEGNHNMKKIGLILSTIVALMVLNFSTVHAFTVHDIAIAVKAGDLHRADAMANQLVKQSPSDPRYHWVYANVLVREGEVNAAKVQLDKAEELAPGLPFVQDRNYLDKVKTQLYRTEAIQVQSHSNHLFAIWVFIIFAVSGFGIFLLVMRKKTKDAIQSRYYTNSSNPNPNSNSLHNYNDSYSAGARSYNRPVPDPRPYGYTAPSGPTIINNGGNNDGLLTGVLVGEALSRNNNSGSNNNNTTIIEDRGSNNKEPAPQDNTDFGTRSSDSNSNSSNTDFGMDSSKSSDSSSTDSSSSSDFGMGSDSSSDSGGGYDSGSSSDFGSDSGGSGGDFGSD